jgi:poly-gamma-glutamate capsule biosynthesis protein CapA/YwtB (metallophosphatase superfamily)
MKFKNWLIAALCSIIAPLSFSQVQYVSNDSVSFLKLLFVGDLSNDKRLIESVYDPSSQTYDFQSMFHFIRPILNLGDIVVGNLETTIGAPPFGNYPLYKSPNDFALALKYAGFNLLMTANSKATHQTLDEWKSQKALLDKYGIQQTGTFENEADYHKRNPYIIEKKGIKVAFLNYMQGISHDKDKFPIVNGVNEEVLERDINKAKEKGADYIVVYFHWGTEFQGYANVVQQKLGQFAVKKGANLVVGTRPHLVQQFENREVVIDNRVHEYLLAYSLGDLYTTAVSHDVNGSIILEVIISKRKSTGKTTVTDFGFISTYTQTFERKGRATWAVLPVSEAKKGNISVPMSAEQINKMNSAADKIKFKLANVIDEVQYELSDKILEEVAEVLLVTRRPLNEDKEFRLDPQEKLLSYKGFMSSEKTEPIAQQTSKPEPVKVQEPPKPTPASKPTPKPVEQPAPKPTPKPVVIETKEEPKTTTKQVTKPTQPLPSFERANDDNLAEEIEKIIPVVNEEISEGRESSEIIYRVQFLALKTKIDINTQYYKHLEGYDVVFEEGYYKYMIGRTTNLKAINDLALDVKRLGHRTAFVVAYRDGNRIKF